MKLYTDKSVSASLEQFQFRFDQVEVSAVPTVAQLRNSMPVARLRRLAPSFRIFSTKVRRRIPYKSRVIFTAPASSEFWSLLLQHEPGLEHRLRRIELAFDLSVADEVEARDTLEWLVLHLRKPWHSRKELQIVYNPNSRPPPGLLRLPTAYFEAAKSQTALKVYARHLKPEQGTGMVVRVEFTLTGGRNIFDKTFISELSDLPRFDPRSFGKRYLRFEEIDIERFGLWAKAQDLPVDVQTHAPPGTDEALLAGSRYLAASTFKAMSEGDEPMAAAWKHHSSAQVRGSLRKKAQGRSRKTKGRHAKVGVVDRFFKPVRD